MLLFTFDGQLSLDNILLQDGMWIRPGTLLSFDGERLYPFIEPIISSYTLTNTLPSYGIAASRISFNISVTCINTSDPGIPLNVSVPVPPGFSLVNGVSNEGEYTEGVWTPTLVNNVATLNLILECHTPGPYTQTVKLAGTSNELVSTCVVSPSDTAAINYNDESLSDYPDTLANLQDGKLYTISKYCKVDDSTLSGIHNGIKNNRLSVVNGIETFGSRAAEEGIYTKIVTTFLYDSNNPVTIRWYGQYLTISTTDETRYAGLTIKEGFDTEYEESVNLLTNPQALLDDTGKTDLILLGSESSAEYIYTVPSTDLVRNSFFVEIEPGLNSFAEQSSQIEIQLSTNQVISDIYSVITQNTGKITFPVDVRIWGLRSDDIINKEINIHITFVNPIISPGIFSYSNIVLELSYLDDETIGSRGYTLDNIHSRNYGIFVDESIDKPEGLNLDVATLTLSNTVGEIVVGSKIKSKEIKVPFQIMADNIEDAQKRLSKAVLWMSSDRNELNIPIPKKLIFDMDPSREFNAILHGVVETTLKVGVYEAKAIFMIPDGVAYSLLKTTGRYGVNNGIIDVWPRIQIAATGADHITLTENVSGRVLTINEEIETGTVMVLDCETRKLYNPATDEDYTPSIGLDSSWPVLRQNYAFSIDGGVIQKVEYREGY